MAAAGPLAAMALVAAVFAPRCALAAAAAAVEPPATAPVATAPAAGAPAAGAPTAGAPAASAQAAATSPATAPASTAPLQATDADMNDFYKNPSPARVAWLMLYFDAGPQSASPGAQPPIIGFLAAAFHRYPDDIDRMIPPALSVRMLGNVATALRLAGLDARAQSIVARMKSTGSAVPDLAVVPASLDAVPALGPSEFDLFWGASFASGDPRYAAKILARFAAVANVDGNADDLLAIARNVQSRGDLHWLIDKRGREKAQALVQVSTALWALDVNARHHEFIRTLVGDYVRAHPAEPASRALVALAHQYGSYDVRKIVAMSEAVPGKPSATVDVGLFSRMLDDLGSHAGSYPVQFDPPEDRQRALADVQAIGALLDPLAGQFDRSPPLLLRLGQLHAIGHNLDIPGSAEKAAAAFTALLKLTPDDAQANFRYGVFLAESTRRGEAVPYLDKARTLGVANADYWLGVSYLAAGDLEQAAQNLQTYTARVPTDDNAARMLDAVRRGQVQSKSPAAVP